MAELAYLQVTRECNQSCLFCSNPRSGKAITLEECQTKLREFKDLGFEGVILTGGEPTLSEDLPALIRASIDAGLGVRLITNGQRCADLQYLRGLYAAGLRHLHVSVHSVRPEIQQRLSGNPDSLAGIERCLDNCAALEIKADVNVTIQAYNQDHLDEIVRYVVERWQQVSHFVFNFLDPGGPMAKAHPDTIPSLPLTELSLHAALTFLEGRGLGYRVERVPLCYMTEFAHASTETRKIVKGESRAIHFLDEKGTVVQRKFGHDKTECCRVCRLDGICAGLFEPGVAYSSDWLYPVFVAPRPIIDRILGGG